MKPDNKGPREAFFLQLACYGQRYHLDGASMLRHAKTLMTRQERQDLDMMADHRALNGESRTASWDSFIQLCEHRLSKPRLS